MITDRTVERLQLIGEPTEAKLPSNGRADHCGEQSARGDLRHRLRHRGRRVVNESEVRLRVAVNLITENPNLPSGAHWVWTRLLPEMAERLEPGEELHALVSPAMRRFYDGLGDGVRFITYPWSNERRNLRVLSEHLYSPIRLPLSRIDVFASLMAPVFNPTWSLVVHMKTMHAFTTPESISRLNRAYRQMSYPRSARIAEAVIITSRSLKNEIEQHLQVDPAKLRLVYEAVDHDLFKPGDIDLARAELAGRGVRGPFVLFVSALWPYKNCEGLLRAWAATRHLLHGRQLVIVGTTRDHLYASSLRSLADELRIAEDVVFVGGIPLHQTVSFYRAADVFVYPSFNETFGLPILEAMACGCPVVTSNVTAMPEIAGGAAVLVDPHDHMSIGRGIVEAAGAGDRFRDAGLRRAGEFTWGAAAGATLDVYREVGESRRRAFRQ